ncbi:SDR family oxidoreductase [Pendulispora brunnea]|uniref:SDR family oxidoreductase n=1 Tax=Pendulispora brunnea TaxID=2905690 RepID=A0ABZ2KNJ8_9BACT
MREKTALVTGANKGIGLEIARQLGGKGFRLWLGCRDPGRGERAAIELRKAGVDARALLLDVTSDASVAKAASTFGEASNHLDVLVNNAGIDIGGFALPREQRVDDIRAIYEVNTFGPIRVTQAFLPFLEKAGSARIVMMSSSLGSITSALDPTSETYGVNRLGYNSSKSALNMITVLFAKTLAAHGIKVNAANPGYTGTDLNEHHGPRTVEEGAAIAVRLATIGPACPTAGFFRRPLQQPSPPRVVTAPGDRRLLVRFPGMRYRGGTFVRDGRFHGSRSLWHR